MDIAALRKRDADLYARLPAFMLKGEHLVLANAMFHPGRLMNELNATNFIIDHESEPFCLKTICDIYAALTERVRNSRASHSKSAMCSFRTKTGNICSSLQQQRTPRPRWSAYMQHSVKL